MNITINKALEQKQVQYKSSLDGLNSQKDQHLRIGVVNLMPTVIETEKQWTELLLSHNSIAVDLVFFHSLVRPSTRVDNAYLEKNYHNWQNYDFDSLDGLVITGAPVELLEFEEVDFYAEVCQIIAKSINSNLSLMLICWAAQAALHYLYGIKKTNIDKKLFGVYEHRFFNYKHPLLKNFTTKQLKACISRQTKIDSIEVLEYTDLILASAIDGLDCLVDKKFNITYMFNHLEYTQDTLEAEYLRDLAANKDIKKPYNYYDQRNNINYSWQQDRKLFYSNWLDTL